jgi:hypothetical protein
MQVSRMIEMIATTTLCTTPSSASSGKGAITTQKLHRKAVVLAVLQLLEPKVQIFLQFSNHTKLCVHVAALCLHYYLHY